MLRDVQAFDVCVDFRTSTKRFKPKGYLRCPDKFDSPYCCCLWFLQVPQKSEEEEG